MSGDEQTFETLTTASLRGPDVNAKDSKSMNARQYFAERSGLPRETLDAFNELIANVLRTNQEVQEHFDVESSDDEDFFDALESQEP